MFLTRWKTEWRQDKCSKLTTKNPKIWETKFESIAQRKDWIIRFWTTFVNLVAQVQVSSAMRSMNSWQWRRLMPWNMRWRFEGIHQSNTSCHIPVPWVYIMLFFQFSPVDGTGGPCSKTKTLKILAMFALPLKTQVDCGWLWVCLGGRPFYHSKIKHLETNPWHNNLQQKGEV